MLFRSGMGTGKGRGKDMEMGKEKGRVLELATVRVGIDKGAKLGWGMDMILELDLRSCT